jgi:serine/threonine protein kinase
VDPLQPEDPERIGRFRVEARLGAGGMGRVYLGRTPEGRQAAIKVVRDDLAGDTGFRQRFRREVSAALSVAGLFTARVLDADPDGDPPWLATEYVSGPSLSEAVARSGPLPAPRLLELAGGLAEALAAIHAGGLVHRDLKPANVLLSPTGPKVIDFGIAWSAGSTQLTGTGQVVGTPEYMAPEQISGSAPGGSAIDVFALGSTLVFAATGRSPFAADSATAALFRVVQSEPDLAGVPGEVLALVRACLDKDPQRRPSAQQIAVGLRGGGAVPQRVPDPRPTAALPTTPQATPPARSRRGWTVTAPAALVVVAAVAAASVLLINRDRSGPDPTPPVVASGSPTPSAAPVDPASEQARYVDRLCAAGDLLTTLGSTNAVPQPTNDPVVARKDFLTAMDRVIAVADAGLADFTALRDDAPTDQLRTGFGQVVEEFTSAKSSFTDARREVQGADPLTVEAYQAGIDEFADGGRNLAFAAQIVPTLTLPQDYKDAYPAAQHCTD